MFKGLFGSSDPAKADEPPSEDPLSGLEEPTALSADRGGLSQGKGFDPGPLERAAKLAQQFGRNEQARGWLLARRMEEQASQKEHQEEGSKWRAQARELSKQAQFMANQARSELQQVALQHEKTREQYKDQLQRKLDVDLRDYRRMERAQEQKARQAAELRADEIRRSTLAFEAQLRQQTDLERVKAQTEGNIHADRQNHDLRIEQAREKARETRTTVMESIKLAGDTVGRGLNEFLTNKEQMTAAVATLSSVALGLYAAKTGTGIAGRYVEARLGKPSLVRETSRRSLPDNLRHPIQGLKQWFSRYHGRPDDVLGDPKGVRPKAIFRKDLERQLRRIASSTSNTKLNRAPFRHLLLHGPPGTGKTLFAKGLAQQSGLEYAIMTGGDVAPLGREGVSEVHKLFDWAQTSKRGVLLFVDEADAFLRRRSTEVISEDMRNALNAFLYRTGEQTDRFMVVYASNQPEQFDEAINDRIDEMVKFDLPGKEERHRMIDFYLMKYIHAATGGEKKSRVLSFLRGGKIDASAIKVEGVTAAHIEEAVASTEGFSGREISKLAIAWQAAAYGSDDCRFTPELMRDVLDSFIEQKQTKQQWDDTAMAEFLEDSEDQHDTSHHQNTVPGLHPGLAM